MNVVNDSCVLCNHVGRHTLAHWRDEWVTNESSPEIDNFLLGLGQSLLLKVILVNRCRETRKILSSIALARDNQVSCLVLWMSCKDESCEEVDHLVCDLVHCSRERVSIGEACVHGLVHKEDISFIHPGATALRQPND